MERLRYLGEDLGDIVRDGIDNISDRVAKMSGVEIQRGEPTRRETRQMEREAKQTAESKIGEAGKK